MKHSIYWINNILKSAQYIDHDQNPNAFKETVLIHCDNYADKPREIGILYHELFKIFEERLKTKEHMSARDQALADLLIELDTRTGEHSHNDILGRFYTSFQNSDSDSSKALALRSCERALWKTPVDRLSKRMTKLSRAMREGQAVPDFDIYGTICDDRGTQYFVNNNPFETLGQRSRTAMKSLCTMFTQDPLDKVLKKEETAFGAAPILNLLCYHAADEIAEKRGVDEALFNVIHNGLTNNKTAVRGLSYWADGLATYLKASHNDKRLGDMMKALQAGAESGDMVRPLKPDSLISLMLLRDKYVSFQAQNSLDAFIDAHSKQFPGSTPDLFAFGLEPLFKLFAKGNWKETERPNAARQHAETILHYMDRMLDNPVPAGREDVIKRSLYFFREALDQSSVIYPKNRLQWWVDHLDQKANNLSTVTRRPKPNQGGNTPKP